MHCKKLTIFVLVFLLAGCQAGTPYILDVAYLVVKPGSSVTQHKTLTIPANKARVYLQGGQVISEAVIDRYYPNCSLEVKTLKPTAQKISADKYKILKIAFDEESSAKHILYASRRFVIDVDGGSSSHEDWVTHFFLQSANQTDVFRLTCGHWEDPALHPRHLTLAEIKKAVGSYFSFEN